ncbi:MAG: nucleotidyltransferase domain-containing protein [Candidatus Margulisiibacteriota bacterium]
MAHENNGTFFSFCRDASLVYLNTNGPTSWRDNFDKILVNGQGKIEIATSVDPLAVKLFGTALASLLRRHFDLRVYFVEGNKEIGLGRPIIGTTETEEIFKPHRELVSKGCVMVSDCDYDPAGNYVGLGGGNVIALGVPPQEEKTANQPVSPATSASPELSRKRIDLVRNFLAAGQAPNIRAVIVFGSTARGQARTNSDLDLMLVCQTANRHEEEKFITTLCSLPDCPEILLPPTPIIPDEPDIFAREVSLKFIPFYLLERIGIKVSGAGLDPSKAFIEDYVVVARTSEEAEQIRAKIEAKKAEILNQLTQMGSSS